MRNDWIVPNTGYKQQTFSISLSQQINKYIKLDAKVNYYRKDSDNLPMTGYGGSSIMACLMFVGMLVSVSKHSSLPETDHDRRRRGMRRYSGAEEGDPTATTPTTRLTSSSTNWTATACSAIWQRRSTSPKSFR